MPHFPRVDGGVNEIKKRSTRDSLYFFYALAPPLCMRVVIFTRARVYLNEENEGLFVVQRGKAGLNWLERSENVKSAGSKGSLATA